MQTSNRRSDSEKIKYLKELTKDAGTECITTDYQLDGGYPRCQFSYGCVKLSRVVLEIYQGPSNLNALHKCQSKACVNPKHLYWGDQSQNLKDAYNSNNRTSRKNKPKTTLTWDQVCEIRQITNMTQAEIASRYKVSRQSINDIVNFRSRRTS